MPWQLALVIALCTSGIGAAIGYCWGYQTALDHAARYKPRRYPPAID